MPAQKIPVRQPVGDPFSGFVLQIGSSSALAVNPEPHSGVIANGDFVIRYGIPYLGKPHLSIIPALVALDYGEMLTGEDAWTFLLKRSNLHPRADVVGYRNDGVDDMIVVKLLDLAQPNQDLVYTDPGATVPITHVTALIAQDTTNLPLRLLENLPHYESTSQWQAAHV
jgi:hypothetical protein